MESNSDIVKQTKNKQFESDIYASVCFPETAREYKNGIGQLKRRLYLEDIGGVATERTGCHGIAETATEDIELVVRAVIAVSVKAIAAIPATFGRLLLLVALFNKILNHLRQANRARLELGDRSSVLVKMRGLADGRFFRRRNSKHARKLPVKQPPEPGFQDWFGRVDPDRFSQRLGIDIDRLDLHRKRHGDSGTSKSQGFWGFALISATRLNFGIQNQSSTETETLAFTEKQNLLKIQTKIAFTELFPSFSSQLTKQKFTVFF